MRLLNIDKLELREFSENQVPLYAILSHRWEADEITFKQLTKRQNLKAAGWKKTENFCAFIRQTFYESWESDPLVYNYPRRVFDWVWIDTCCIDKRSSAEQTEAINSMYKWYRNALICYVYMSDVSCEPENVCIHDDLLSLTEVRKYHFGQCSILPCRSHVPFHDGSISEPRSFGSSAWFRRSWTLQELIAPEHVLFVDKKWNLFGGKHHMKS